VGERGGRARAEVEACVPSANSGTIRKVTGRSSACSTRASGVCTACDASSIALIAWLCSFVMRSGAASASVAKRASVRPITSTYGRSSSWRVAGIVNARSTPAIVACKPLASVAAHRPTPSRTYGSGLCTRSALSRTSASRKAAATASAVAETLLV
jgi:hypothetical protein